MDQLRLELEAQSEVLGVVLPLAVRTQVVQWMAALVMTAVKQDGDSSRSAEDSSDE